MAGHGEIEEMQTFVEAGAVTEFAHIVDADGSIWAEFGVRAQPAFVFLNGNGAIALHYGSLGVEDLSIVVQELALN